MSAHRVSSGESGSDAIRDELVRRITRVAEGSGTAAVNVIPAVSGSPVRAIADYTDRVSADLIVVGKKARRASGYWSAGSFAAAVGKAVKSPTIAVPMVTCRRSGTIFRNILAPIDFSEVSLRALSEALVIASGARTPSAASSLDGFLRSGRVRVSGFVDATISRRCTRVNASAVDDPNGRAELERDRCENGIRPCP